MGKCDLSEKGTWSEI